jgi:iron complex outermembrane receptor protein
MNRRSLRARILGGSALICSFAAGPLFASSAVAQEAPAPTPDQASTPVPAARPQSGLSEIVVTAQRREENLQEVPIAIAAMTSETLESAGIDATNTLTQAVPSVQFSRSGPSGLFFIRGVGTTNASGGEEGSNAFYVDNVYIPDLAGTITNFNNIERIEVLKGPQGTLFGRNAFGGLVHVITKDPGDSLEVNAEGGYGNYETVNGKLYVAGPLTSTLGASVALTGQDQGKGWGYNATLNEEIRQEDYWGARGKLLWEPSPSAKITLSGDYYSIDDDTAISWALDEDYIAAGGFESAGSMVSLGDVPSHTSIDQWGGSITGEFDLGFAELTSITAVRDTDNHSNFDVDASPAPNLRIDYVSGTRAYQQELRLASSDAGPLNWQVGAFYLRSKQTNYSYLLGLAASGGLGPGAGILIDAQLVTDSYAGFVKSAMTSLRPLM